MASHFHFGLLREVAHTNHNITSRSIGHPSFNYFPGRITADIKCRRWMKPNRNELSASVPLKPHVCCYEFLLGCLCGEPAHQSANQDDTKLEALPSPSLSWLFPAPVTLTHISSNVRWPATHTNKMSYERWNSTCAARFSTNKTQENIQPKQSRS